jgi:hypothetical protein
MPGRVLFGYNPIRDTHGLWVSKAGRDCGSLNPDDLLFDMDHYFDLNTLRGAGYSMYYGPYNFVNRAISVVNHNFGYVPQFELTGYSNDFEIFADCDASRLVIYTLIWPGGRTDTLLTNGGLPLFYYALKRRPVVG